MADEHAEMQAELKTVKKALQSDGAYLGMKGETLQRYFLQLNEKENLLLKANISSKFLDEGAGLLQTSTAAANGSSKHGGYTAAGVPVAGAGAGGASCKPPMEVIKPREPPAGATRALDRDNLESVVSHLEDYEGSLLETTKALRALSSLAYADAGRVGSAPSVLPQVLRALAIHPNDDGVQLAAMRAFCNMAYSPTVALNSLATDEGVLSALVGAMARTSGTKDIGAKASEAIARIVAAEAEPEADGKAKSSSKQPGPLCGFFVAASGGDASWQGVALQLVLQMIANEVVVPELVARNFSAAAGGAQRWGSSSMGWLGLAKQFASCPQCPEIAQALIEADTVAAAAGVMEAHVEDGSVQLAGIEGLSSLVGNRWAGLQAFAKVQGMKRIEAAMRAHPNDSVLQTKGVRALASGIQWPEEVQKTSAYNWEYSVEMTKTAMSQHGSNSELQVAALEALAKYLDRLHCIAQVKADGGEGLVKAMMTRHIGVAKVQSWGKAVLDAVGSTNWAPRNTAAA